MERTTEKLSKFSEMVMQEANRQKSELKKQAELERDELIAASEIQYLKSAYEKIQDAVRKIDKTMNEEVSKAIVESKQALFNRRDEIIDSVFVNLRSRLSEYCKSEEYRQTSESLLKRAFEEVGEGDIRLLVDPDDVVLFESIRSKLNLGYKVVESDETLLGGFLVVNRSRGFIWDYSFINKLSQERQTFLEKYELTIE